MHLLHEVQERHIIMVQCTRLHLQLHCCTIRTVFIVLISYHNNVIVLYTWLEFESDIKV